jgi:hypothetical protein
MGTVLVDRYRVICENCGYDSEFMIGAGRGDYDAVHEARRIHANVNESQERQCPTDRFLMVTKLEKSASLEDQPR